MKSNTEIKDWYVSKFNAFEQSLNGTKDAPFHQIRKTALSRFSELGFPGRRDEEWKYTNLSPLLKHKLSFSETKNVSEKNINKYAFKGLEENLIIFVNGYFSKKFSNFSSSANGVIVDSLENGLQTHGDLIAPHLAKHADFEHEHFVALNTAFAQDGYFIYVPDNVVVEETIHILYLSDASESSFFAAPRNLIFGGKNCQIKIIERHCGWGENPYFNNVVTEVIAEDNSRIDHVRIQDESLNAYHIFALQAQQHRDSHYSLVNVDLGGVLVRNNLNLALDAEHCEGHLIGFYMGTGKQHVDNHTVIDHIKPNCYSNEVYKGILGGKATGVFNGKIFVREDAQKTNAYQDNKALLLSDDARVNTKPQLEIFADDVKCSHGATVGQLDNEALFYLRSRGIPEEKAYSTLQYAFASEVFGYISNEAVREQLNEILLERFPNL